MIVPGNGATGGEKVGGGSGWVLGGEGEGWWCATCIETSGCAELFRMFGNGSVISSLV